MYFCALQVTKYRTTGECFTNEKLQQYPLKLLHTHNKYCFDLIDDDLPVDLDYCQWTATAPMNTQ